MWSSFKDVKRLFARHSSLSSPGDDARVSLQEDRLEDLPASPLANECGPRSCGAVLPPTRELAGREDETTGGFVTSFGLGVWFASHIGPALAHKIENQDIALARTGDGRVWFAICDGVSTSFGSRFASALACHAFVDKLAMSNTHDLGAFEDLLCAASFAEDELDKSLMGLLANSSPDAWDDVKGGSMLDTQVIRRLAENTASPINRFWGPVMTSTLLGGVAVRVGNSWKVNLIRIGDGVAEKQNSSGVLDALFGVSSDEFEISNALRPGAPSVALRERVEHATLILEPGELLLLCSDGLARGHNERVLDMLHGLFPDFSLDPSLHSGVAALDLLRRAASRADELFNTMAALPPLFADNLSVILLKCDFNLTYGKA